MTDNHPTLKLWEPSDYPQVCGWWAGHGWNPVPLALLPPLGVLAPSAAGWAYMDNGGTGVAMIEWLVTDPEASPRAAVAALRAVVDFLKAELLRLNYAHALTTCRQESLARFLEKRGFTRTDSGMIHFVAKL